WFSGEEGKKGEIAPGQRADLAVLSEDFFSIPEERIKRLQSVLTILGGAVVHAADEFADLAPPQLPVMPDWSPIAHFGGYGAPRYQASRGDAHPVGCACEVHRPHPSGCNCPAHRFTAPDVLTRVLSDATGPLDRVL